MIIRPVPSCCVLTARRISRGHLPFLFLVASHAPDCRLVCRLWGEHLLRAPCSALPTLSSGLDLKLASRPCSAGILLAVFLCGPAPRKPGLTPARQPLLACASTTRQWHTPAFPSPFLQSHPPHSGFAHTPSKRTCTKRTEGRPKKASVGAATLPKVLLPLPPHAVKETPRHARARTSRSD